MRALFFRGRSAVVLLVLLGATAIGLPRQMKLAAMGKDLAATRARLAVLEQRSAAELAELEDVRAELRAQNERRDQVLLKVAATEKELARINPESRWVEPPAGTPEWDSESPYVWLSKELVRRLPVSAFNPQGELRAEVAYVLTLDPPTLRKLNQQLKEAVKEYRELEVAGARQIDEHLPGIAGREGEKVTVRIQPQPEEGAKFKERFTGALNDCIGEQRAGLLLQLAHLWIDEQFAQFGAEPKIISVVRNSRGDYNVTVKSSGSTLSTGGPAEQMGQYIPPHLMPMFAEFFKGANE